MGKSKLLGRTKVGGLRLDNSIVMAPMTRCRALGNIPNELMSLYYKQRSSAGLIITEGTSPSPNGLGYARIPGIYNVEQKAGWEITTEAVHIAGGRIFVQLMHTGRVSHRMNMPEESKILAPSALKLAGQMWTDSAQLQDYPVPTEMTPEDIASTILEYVSASENAMHVWFDGVELHGANGYLLEQFISPVSNIRTDAYGGSIERRCRFVVEVVAAVSEAIGKHKVGIRLSPYGVAGGMTSYAEIDATYKYLSDKLNELDIAYIHLVDHSSMGAPVVPIEIKKLIRHEFKNKLILCGGYDQKRAEDDIKSGLCDLIAFGRPFINNPDLVERFTNDWALSSDLHTELFYTADGKGYTDYPCYKV